MSRAFYQSSIAEFPADDAVVLGRLVQQSSFAVESTQRNAWLTQIAILRKVFAAFPAGHVYFEYSVPRLGKRIDVVLVIASVVFVIEFKVGETEFASHAIDQVYDYSLDLKNFHEASHDLFIAPVLVATEARDADVRGDRWQRVRKAERQKYLKNAYRVLLTRARQGMVIVVPEGDSSDPTRDAAFYDPVWEYLKELGLQTLAN